MRLRDLLVALFLLLAPVAAHAHPHEWVDVATEVLFDDRGRLAALRHHWRFDEAFTAFALQGLDQDGDGSYSPEELQPLAQVNVESLAEYGFFTFVSVGDYTAGFAAPKEYSLDLADDRLTLHYTLPLLQPLLTKSQVLVQVYDPEYYIAFALPSAEAVRLVGAPSGCRLDVYPAQGPDAAAAAALATIGPDQRELPEDMQGLTGGIDNSAEINCGGPTVGAAAGSQPAPRNAGEAAQVMAQGTVGGGQGDLTALPALPTGPAPAEPDAAQSLAAPAAAPATGGTQAAAPAPEASAARAEPAAPRSAAGFMARIGALQTAFNRELTAALKGLKTDGSMFWWLGGISFAYGIVHAAGPGHGKVVISSYLVANEQRIRRGVAIAFLAAFVQALVAVGIVGLMAALLNMTSMAITDTAKLFETGSFALVAGLGLYLLARKGAQAFAMLRGGDPHAHHHHHHRVAPSGPSPSPSPQGGGEGASPPPLWGRARVGVAPSASGRHAHHHGSHSEACAHHHHPEPATLERPGLSGAAAAVLSVGIRPCSGALVVLVFALAQGIFWAGVASTFLMALGTAITVAALAGLAVGAKDIARRLSAGNDRRAGQVILGLELLAALFITALGVVLFVGSLAA